MNRYHYINEGQISGILTAADAELRLAILLASFAGLRFGEIADLKWTDVDLDQKLTPRGSRRIFPSQVKHLCEMVARAWRFISGW